MAAQVQSRATFAVGSVAPPFSAASFIRDEFHQSYVVTPDGRSFLFAVTRQRAAGAGPPRLVWVDHWFSEVRSRLKH
jgi:hypothetical protein